MYCTDSSLQCETTNFFHQMRQEVNISHNHNHLDGSCDRYIGKLRIEVNSVSPPVLLFAGLKNCPTKADV